MTPTEAEVLAVHEALSVARMETFKNAVGNSTRRDAAALDLYAWNAQVSSALLMPLHVCEVVIRNAVSEALETVYGQRWPWSPGFERSLPSPYRGYNARRDLQSARRAAPTTGKVIPELKFVFWQKMFTSRYDRRIWAAQRASLFPNLDSSTSVAVFRGTVYDSLDQVRALRNRVAHHEPVFSRNLADDLQVITELVRFRSGPTAQWMASYEKATEAIGAKPAV